MTTCFWHPDCVRHDPGPGHSERGERLTAIHAALARTPGLEWRDAPRGDVEAITRVHSPAYVDFVFKTVPAQGHATIEVNGVTSDDDGGEVTTLSPGSGEALLRATGAVTAAVDHVMRPGGTSGGAFCLTRPPGHHALYSNAMGFCVFNNAAIAARYAQAAHGARRVAIVDFDVHHGNGTQDIFLEDGSVFFASIHQLPLWPESGRSDEVGCGNVLNVPVPPNVPSSTWMDRWHGTLLPRLRSEVCDILIVSAGFDAHADDPKGSQRLATDDFYRITGDLMGIAERKCKGRVVSMLEGGYDIAASASSCSSHVAAMMGSGPGHERRIGSFQAHRQPYP